MMETKSHLAILPAKNEKKGTGKDKTGKAHLGIHIREEGEEMLQEHLPAAVRRAAGPLGSRVMMGRVRRGRGRREELVGKDGGGPLATDYRRHGAALLRRSSLLAPPVPQPIPAVAVLLAAAAGHPVQAPAAVPFNRRSTAGPPPSASWSPPP
ncbi:hypothetical protein PR202_gb28004 [Eleusine coracana subsp. coracana]|uniref:Uncharacterized protein n=1 Tax=Eleusine coracana subsp. coracana TaxID=191504 RepID=A0AAV5FT82_ELECO|nr:hypothetical protein PR202_gb28004 [Eleusine coracana subsp. coracana]